MFTIYRVVNHNLFKQLEIPLDVTKFVSKFAMEYEYLALERRITHVENFFSPKLPQFLSIFK